MGRNGQANAPHEVVLLLCQREELLVVRPRIIAMTPSLSRYLDMLRFAAAFRGAGPAPARLQGPWRPASQNIAGPIRAWRIALSAQAAAPEKAPLPLPVIS